MPKKPRERFKDRFKSKTKNEPKADQKPSTSLEIVRRRRNKRFLVIALIGIAFPIFELVAYRYRAITLSFANRTDQTILSLKVTYDGGSFDLPEIKPGGIAVRVIRPDFSFQSAKFSTYWMTISLVPENKHIFRLSGRAGALDYSATEIYNIVPTASPGDVEIQHTTRPGFPLGFVRDLMGRLGFK